MPGQFCPESVLGVRRGAGAKPLDARGLSRGVHDRRQHPHRGPQHQDRRKRGGGLLRHRSGSAPCGCCSSLPAYVVVKHSRSPGMTSTSSGDGFAYAGTSNGSERNSSSAPPRRPVSCALSLPSRCACALQRHGKAQREERSAAALKWDPLPHQPQGLIFTTPTGRPTDPRSLNRMLTILCRDAKVRRVRVHDLRHTCAPLLLAQGVDAREPSWRRSGTAPSP